VESRELDETDGEDSDDDPDDKPLTPESPRHSGAPAKKPSRVEDTRSPRAPRTVKVRAEMFEAAFMSLLKRASLLKKDKEKPPDPAWASVFHSLLDMAIEIAPRCHDGVLLETRLLNQWLQAGRRCRGRRVGYDDLDRCVAALCTRKEIGDPGHARAAHDALQRWLHGELDEAAVEQLEPRITNSEVARLHPAASQSEWSDAWRRIAEAETSWTEVSRMMAAIDAGKSPCIPNGIDQDAAQTLKSVATGLAFRACVVSIVDEWSGQPACPRCRMVLAREAAHELRAHRVTRCRSCGRVVVDMSL
jgi:hypothetical protein